MNMITVDIIATINMSAHIWDDFFIKITHGIIYKIFMTQNMDYRAKCVFLSALLIIMC